MPLKLSADTRLLFIGDSITDCGRKTCAERLGHGYVRLIRDWLACADPAALPLVVNMGTSGDKISDLADRWQSDVIAQKPDILSLKIGINDVWHSFAHSGLGTTVSAFREGYAELLTQLSHALPKCQVILCEPSVIDPPQHERGNELLPQYVQVVHEIASEFGAVVVVPLHEAFIQARNDRPDLQWTSDGVHPTELGHMLIARQWLLATGLV